MTQDNVCQTASISVLDSLKNKLSEILEYFDNKSRVIYYDYPLHLNVGDLLINLGTEEFFRAHDVEVWRRFSAFDLPLSVKGIDDRVVILCHGGGNFGDLYGYYQKGRERVLQMFPNNRVVVLPQTVHFRSREALGKSITHFRDHKDCHVFVRDSRSLEILRSAGLTSVAMMPDMAHALWKNIRPALSRALKTGPLRFARRDDEARAHAGLEAHSTVDWSDILTLPTRITANIWLKLISAQNKLGLDSDKTRQWYPQRDRAIFDGIHFFSQYQEIHTNRLHAMLLGLLLERRVLGFDNSYGKLSSYAQTWLASMPELEISGGV